MHGQEVDLALLFVKPEHRVVQHWLSTLLVRLLHDFAVVLAHPAQLDGLTIVQLLSPAQASCALQVRHAAPRMALCSSRNGSAWLQGSCCKSQQVAERSAASLAGLFRGEPIACTTGTTDGLTGQAAEGRTAAEGAGQRAERPLAHSFPLRLGQTREVEELWWSSSSGKQMLRQQREGQLLPGAGRAGRCPGWCRLLWQLFSLAGWHWPMLQ